MHAGMVSFWVKPGKTGEAIEVYRSLILPTLDRQKGFEGGLLLTDDGTDEGVIIGLWKRQEDAEAFESGGVYREQVAKLKDVLAAPTVRRVYKVGARA